MASKLLFIGGALKAPPATRDAFQMLPQVGLKTKGTKEDQEWIMNRDFFVFTVLGFHKKFFAIIIFRGGEESFCQL